jgi:hypothetical protein
MDEQITAPIGFNITFSGMLRLAIDMGLEFPIRQTDVHGIFHLREMELKRFDNELCWHKNWCCTSYVLANHMNGNLVSA